LRIAISGTHGSGKTTLIDAFMNAHPEYVHEPEPYTVLTEDYGEEFSDLPSVDEFYRQLEFNLERLEHHSRNDSVIFERSPVDFLAYMMVIDDSGRRESELLASARKLVGDGLRHLDLIVFLPLDSYLPAAEYPKLRTAVDQRLAQMYEDDEFGIRFVEACGSIQQRLRVIETAFAESTK
jgi:predicted ATPase